MKTALAAIVVVAAVVLYQRYRERRYPYGEMSEDWRHDHALQALKRSREVDGTNWDWDAIKQQYRQRAS